MTVAYALLSHTCKLIGLQTRSIRLFMSSVTRIVVVQGPGGERVHPAAAGAIGVELCEVPFGIKRQGHLGQVRAIIDWLLGEVVPQQPERYALILHGDTFPVADVSVPELLGDMPMAGRGPLRQGYFAATTWFAVDARQDVRVSQLNPSAKLWNAVAIEDHRDHAFMRRAADYRAEDHWEWCKPCWLHVDRMASRPVTDRKLAMLRLVFGTPRYVDVCDEVPREEVQPATVEPGGPVDVVYPLSNGSRWGDNELRFSLRSLEKNLLNLGKVYVVGACPGWLDTNEVVYIPAKGGRGPKDVNIIDKVLLACLHTTRFLRLSDDQTLLQAMQAEDILPYGHRQGKLGNKPKRAWPVRLWRTRQWLLEHGHTSHNFDLHLPMMIDATKFVQAMAEAPYKSGLTINTLYGNIAGLEPASIERVRWLNSSATQCHRTIMRKLVASDKAFLNYNNKALTNPLKYSLCLLFPNQSRFEVTDHGLTFDPNRWLGGKGAKSRTVNRPGKPAEHSARHQRSALQTLSKKQRRKLRQQDWRRGERT